MDRALFTLRVGTVFEHSPWVAARTASARPFATRAELQGALFDTVMKASDDEKIGLIRAHPDLVGDADLTNESRSEQQSAGLDDLSADERERLRDFNRRYCERFGFPFVICAGENKKEATLVAFPRRLTNSREQEIETALQEIFKIAELRLRDLIP